MFKTRMVILGAAVLLVAIQLIPVRRTNPPGGSEITAPGNVAVILKRSCCDCHSNNTHWPWYSRIAPISWVIVQDVNEAREALNFSEWERYSENERAELAGKIEEEISKGDMPLKRYVFIHRDASLGEDDAASILAWTRARRDTDGRAR